MVLLSRAPFGLLHPRAMVKWRILELKRSRDSEASAEHNEMGCMKPVDSVHKVTIKFSIRTSIESLCRLLLSVMRAVPLPSL